MRERDWDIEYKTPEQVAKMRTAGLLVAATLDKLRAAVAPGVSTADLDAIAEQHIRAAGGIPSFLGYQGYPASICSSVNNEIVHAIPSPDVVLRDGDVISIDCGAIVDGWHGDSAITVAVGEVRADVRRMATVAEDAMWAGIVAAARGLRSGRGRLTDISAAIQTSVPRRGGTASSRATAATVSAARCTRIRSCSTTAAPARVPGSYPACASPSSRC